MAKTPNTQMLAAYLVTVLIGGSNFVAIRFSNFELPPFWGAAIRFGAASLLFLSIILIRRISLPRGRPLLGAILYGIFAFAASYAFGYYALVEVNAGLASVILGMTPLATFLLAVAHRLESFRWRSLLGALISLGGVALIFQEQISAAVPLLSLLALLAGTASTAESSIVVKLFPKTNPYVMNAVGMSTGTFILLALSVLTREKRVLPSMLATWAAFLYLVFIGSAIIFALYLYLLSRWAASAVSYQFVLFPIVTVVVAAWLAGETVTLTFVLGAGLVILGVYAGALAQGFSRAREAAVNRDSASRQDEGLR